MTKQITTSIKFVLDSIFVLAEKSTNSHGKYIRERKKKNKGGEGKTYILNKQLSNGSLVQSNI